MAADWGLYSQSAVPSNLGENAMQRLFGLPLVPNVLVALLLVLMVTLTSIFGMPRGDHSLPHRRAEALELLDEACRRIEGEKTLFTSLVLSTDAANVAKTARSIRDNEQQFHHLSDQIHKKLPEANIVLAKLVDGFDALSASGWHAAGLWYQSPEDAQRSFNSEFIPSYNELWKNSEWTERHLLQP
jgi:hypothetical protein